MKKVLIIIGSKSDFDAVYPCVTTIEGFSVETELRVCSAHRTPELASALAETAEKEGYGVIIAAAGKAAHLAGVVAAHTILPVIGLPIKSSTLDGLDSLLSVVQMPSGIPVATVAINGSVNAGLLAVQMLAIGNAELTAALKDYKKQMKQAVEADNETIQKTIKERRTAK